MGKKNANSSAGRARPDYLFLASKWIVVVTFIVMILSAWAQVIFRYFIQYPLGWTGELCRIMMFWAAFMSVGILVMKRGMMRVDAFVTMMPEKWQAITSVAVHLAQAGLFSWLIWYSIGLIELTAGQTSTALQVPYAYIYLSLPVGLAVGVIYSIIIAWKDLQGLLAGRMHKTERGEGEGL